MSLASTELEIVSPVLPEMEIWPVKVMSPVMVKSAFVIMAIDRAAKVDTSVPTTQSLQYEAQDPWFMSALTGDEQLEDASSPSRQPAVHCKLSVGECLGCERI